MSRPLRARASSEVHSYHSKSCSKVCPETHWQPPPPPLFNRVPDSPADATRSTYVARAMRDPYQAAFGVAGTSIVPCTPTSRKCLVTAAISWKGGKQYTISVGPHAILGKVYINTFQAIALTYCPSGRSQTVGAACCQRLPSRHPLSTPVVVVPPVTVPWL